MQATKMKDVARRLIDELPEDATWDDLMYQVYVCQAIEAGLQDSESEQTLSVEEVRARFGLKP